MSDTPKKMKKYKKPEPGTPGYNLMMARKNAGFTQDKLANLLGISRTMLVQYEHNDAQMRVDIILKLLDVLDETFEDIFKVNDSFGKRQEVSEKDIEKQKILQFILTYQALSTGTYKGTLPEITDEDE